jgi:hypothetical protein
MLIWKNDINEPWRTWYLGQEVPDFERVVIMQADGDELNLIAHAMQATSEYVDGVGYTKGNGGGKFLIKPVVEGNDNGQL